MVVVAGAMVAVVVATAASATAAPFLALGLAWPDLKVLAVILLLVDVCRLCELLLLQG
jgi:hypothetical protein